MFAAARPANAVQNCSSTRSGRYTWASVNTPMSRNAARNASSTGPCMKLKPSGVHTPGNASATLPEVHATSGAHSR